MRATIAALRNVGAVERNRFIDMQAMVTVEEALAVAALVVAVVQVPVTDHVTLGKVQAGMQGIVEELRGPLV